jgi:tetratricopeptide (TPR) repeat protein/opacity protein-like surface antigen
LIFLVFAILLSTSGTAGAERCDKWAAKATSVQGEVEAQKTGETGWTPVKLNDTFCPGDSIRLPERSRADLLLSNGGVMRLSENSSLTLEGEADDRSSVLDIVKGAGHFFSTKPNSLEVKTPYAAAGVRGTEFLVKVDENRTFISIFAGAVFAHNDFGGVELTSGKSAVAEAGKAPVAQVVVKPRDAVRWALYYPPVIYAPGEKSSAGRERPDARFYAGKASELLAVGSVDEANVNIDKALSIDPNFSDAYALQAIIAVVQNDKDKALSLAQNAVRLNPGSATAYLALSYAQQALFDVEGARKALCKAVEEEPQNALAWARLAEVLSMSGRLDKSLEAAQKAANIDPDLSRTQTILGFAYLLEVEIGSAKQAFEKAIQFDQADPLPRLGYGLALIREGHLGQGGKQLEIAASLDPNNSLIRSYLGKVYYEEKRTGLDEREYQIAKELDPKDPTPWFYDAFAKETTNRPVEALQDIQKAIELNDNRAVYRSKLLLDSDEAARSASLAYVYNDLGFQQRALAEGWRAVNLDPTDYSAHRFLSDSYSALPLHEFARTSELLQSQLFQPLNITPLQPQLAQASQFLLSALGPSGSGYNEFNPILTSRNRVALITDGTVGEHSTYGGEGILAAVYDKFSVSGGYSHFETQGWRDNSDQTTNLGNFFVQYELSPKTNLQFEYRHQDFDQGDLELKFYDFLGGTTGQRMIFTGDTYRVGFHQVFSPESQLIGNYVYQQGNPFQILGLASVDRTVDNDLTHAGSGELEYVYRSDHFNLIAGGGYAQTLFNEFTLSEYFAPPPTSSAFNSATKNTNSVLYLYSNIFLPGHFIATVGASYQSLNETYSILQTNTTAEFGKSLFNPKFGLMWTPFPGTTLRAAAFRELNRTLIADQTLEPTQVAGFLQFFDDPNASYAWNYGGGVDQKIGNNLFVGVEYYYRDLTLPSTGTVSSQGQGTVATTSKIDWTVDEARSYIYWAPCNWMSLTAEYYFEKFDRAITDIIDVNTHRVPLGIHLFDSSGLSLAVRGTYINQDGTFYPAATTGPSLTALAGSDSFWLMDAAVSYRLPKRYGIITLGVANLLDQHFHFADTDNFVSTILPSRTVFTRLTLELP